MVRSSPKAATKSLYDLSQKWNIMLQHLNDFEERMKFLLRASKCFTETFQSQATPEEFARALANQSSDEMLIDYLLSKSALCKRWVANYRDRTTSRINLVSASILT